MTAGSKSNSSGVELGHLVKVSKIPFRYIPGFLKTELVKISCFLRQKIVKSKFTEFIAEYAQGRSHPIQM